MWEIILAIVTFVFIAAIIMQIVYIRVNLSHYVKENDVNIVPKPVDSSSKNLIKTYGIKLNVRHSMLIKEINKTNPTPLSVSDIAIVACNQGISSKDVIYNQYTVLVIDKNNGCHTLIHDILTQNTRYILSDSSIYIVHYSSEISEKLKNKMLGNTYTNNKLLESQEIIIVFNLSESFDFKEIDDNRTCSRISVVNFFDLFVNYKPVDTSYGNIADISSSFYIPNIILGFST